MGKFDHLLSPINVGGHLFKNRIVMTPTTPKVLQEDENFIAESTMQHYLRRAKNGAALLTISGLYQFNDTDNPFPPHMWDYFKYRPDEGYNHYMSQLCEGIHAYGSFVVIQMSHEYPADWDISAGVAPFAMNQRESSAMHEITPDQIKASTEKMVETCRKLKVIGFDGISLHMSYQLSLLGRSLSPLTNLRTDQYGGSFENRIRLVAETCQAIKDACGKDFLVDAHITGEELDAQHQPIPGGWTIDDSIRFAEAMSGLIDILHLRGWDIDGQHSLWYQDQTPPYLYLAEACMKAQTETKILATSGYNDPELMDAIIAEGKADLIGMARGLVADPCFIEKLYEGREDEIVPCIRCNKCFGTGPSETTARTCRCSVNPLWGFEGRDRVMVVPSTSQKKVAVLGGGPTGMNAALYARERGHEVELFEIKPTLGGQLCVADYSPRKGVLKKYRDYLAHQLDKQGIPVHLSTNATAEELADQGFDVIVSALGSTPKRPSIPGVDGSTVTDILYVYGHEDELGDTVAVIGAGMSALETAIHLAEDHGKKVTVLGRSAVVGRDMPPIHYRDMFLNYFDETENVDLITEAAIQRITDEGVYYLDPEGVEQFVPANSVVLSTGMAPNFEEAMELFGKGPRVIVVGDNRSSGSIMDCTRDAYFAMSQL